MTIERQSPCKVNLLLNILGKRPDGFHQLETVMHPIALYDLLSFESVGAGGIQLSCNRPDLPTDSRNLVYRAAEQFLKAASIKHGVRVRLKKRIPLAAGLGGGSGNAAVTLVGLNDLFGRPLSAAELETLAAGLGSDVPFFLQNKPALATGRGEKVEPLDFFPALSGAAFVLIHPGFGISTAWAYQQLVKFKDALEGTRVRAQKLVRVLQGSDLAVVGRELYNSLEAPALKKYPLLVLFQEFLRTHGAAGALMSGSGSTTFGLVSSVPVAEALAEKVREKFGSSNWIAVVPVSA